MDAITINGNLVEPATQQEGGSHFFFDASHSNYILIHCADRLENEQYNELERLQVEVLQYIAGDTYFCRYLPAELEEIRKLPFVIYANVYHPDLVIEAGLKEMSRVGADMTPEHAAPTPREQTHDVYIVLHPDPNRGTAELKQKLADRLRIAPDAIHEGENRLQTTIRLQDLEEVARLDKVQTIEKLHEISFHNHVARLNLKVMSSLDIGIDTGLPTPRHYGSGEVIAVADSGLDSGLDATYAGTPFEGRVKLATSFRTDNTTNDTRGHGTHVAGSALGLGDSGTFGVIRGTAPGAQLVVQTIRTITGDSVLPVPPGFKKMFTDAYDDGAARIHCNSYGKVLADDPTPRQQVAYTSFAVDIDSAMKEREDLLIVWSAGNDGKVATDNGAQISSMATAKNAVTVGACETAHPFAFNASESPEYVYDDAAGVGNLSHRNRKPGWTAVSEGNINNVALFSSRGPTKNTAGFLRNNSRIKPDVVAPGVCIYSARTGDASFTNVTQFGDAPDLFGWMFLSGTSQAAPLVAGCCAVIRSQLRRKLGRQKGKSAGTSRLPIPGALVKAVLINGADDLSSGPHLRGPSPGPAPNSVQGHGRVNLARSLLCITDKKNGGTYHGAPLQQNQSNSVKITLNALPPAVAGAAPLRRRLRVTMCYTDAPSTAGSGSLVNVLNLKVTNSQGVKRYGNTGTRTSDGKNNVQKLVWDDIPAGDTNLTVKCKAITRTATNTSQDYALVWYDGLFVDTDGAGSIVNSDALLVDFWSDKVPTEKVAQRVQDYKDEKDEKGN